MEMTSRERILCALNNKEPDTVPIFEFLYSRPLFQGVLGRVPEAYHAEDVMLCAHKIGYDMCFVPFGGQGGFITENVDNKIYKDEWQTTYKKHDNTWPVDAPIAFPITNRNDWLNYEMPDPNLENRLDGVKTCLKMASDFNMAVAGSIRGPFSSAMLLLGIEKLSLLLYDDPELVNEIMEKCTDFFIEGGKRMAMAGVDTILFADDYGFNSAPLMSLEHFKKFILPQVNRMISILKKLGIPVIMHSDGHIKPFLDALVDAGINAYHPIERAAGMDLKEVKQKYGNKLCLMGNVNNKTTLVTGNVQDVVEEVKECIRIAAPGGGYILCSDHSVHDDIPNQNVFALYEAGRRYGRYPISI